MIRGFVIGHRDISNAFAAVLDSISGHVTDIYFFSNEGLSTGELAEAVKKTASDSDEGTIIFVDLYGGSCWRAAKQAKLPKSHVVSGFNLPMLLSFINKRDSYSFDELPAVLKHDAKRGIMLE